MTLRYPLTVTTTLFIATSLDGFIAGPDDDLSWLFTDTDYGFDDFYSSVDALVMGRGTYDVVRKLGKWPYAGKRTVVVTNKENLETPTPDTEGFNGELKELSTTLAESGVKHCWLVGGGELVVSCLHAGLIDTVTVSMHPVLLGQGVRLFPGSFPVTMLEFTDAQSFDSGLIQLNYRVVATEGEFIED